MRCFQVDDVVFGLIALRILVEAVIATFRRALLDSVARSVKAKVSPVLVSFRDGEDVAGFVQERLMVCRNP